MTEVILFQPKTGFFNDLVVSPPIGLLSISRFVAKEFKVKIIDQRFDGWKPLLINQLKKEPICFATTAITGRQIKYALDVSKLVKEHSAARVVWGGVHPTIAPLQTIKNENIDIVVQGEGEYAFHDLIKNLEKNKPINRIRGIWSKKNGKIVSNQRADFVDLNKLPSLPYELIDPRKYNSAINIGNSFDLETGRGCIYNCSFCYNKSYNLNTWRPLSAERIIDELLHLKNHYKKDTFFFIDDCFLASKKRVTELVSHLKQNRLCINWNIEASINDMKQFDTKELQDLDKYGLRFISLGVESGSKRILRLLNKRIAINEVIQINKRLAAFNFIPKYNLVAGYPTETIEELKQTTKLIIKLLQDNPKAIIETLAGLTPYPGTAYYSEALKYGMTEPKKLEDWIHYNTEEWINHAPWLSEKRRKILQLLCFASIFVDDKLDIYSSGKMYSMWLRFLGKLYKPIAKIRISTLSTKLAFENWLLNWYIKRGIKKT